MSDYNIKFSLNGDDNEEIYNPPSCLSGHANIPSISNYHELYDKSIKDSNNYWNNVAKNLYFDKPSCSGLEWNFDIRKGRIFVNFMKDSKTNISYNCLDRIIKNGYGNKIAFKWEGNSPNDYFEITYSELQKRVIEFSKVLRSKGIKKGDVVAIYMPMIVELPIAMLSCLRIGAIHSVVFAGFSADSLSTRILQAKSKMLITVDGFYRGNKFINLRDIVINSYNICLNNDHKIDNIIWLQHLKRVNSINSYSNIELPENSLIWEIEVEKSSNLDDHVEWIEAEEPSFILYTSGSTGTPKGIVHSTAGYMVYAYETTRRTFDADTKNDIYWCMADCGWITGHTYGVYGPLLNGLTTILFEGVPSYPDNSRTWKIVEKYGVTKLYTSPTAVRSLMASSEDYVTNHNRSTLKVIGTVGEPINPSAWRWLYNIVGEKRCAIVDTYWQTETGGHVITAMPGATPTKPGSATLPSFGVIPRIVDSDGNILEGPCEGNLCIAQAWPGMMRTVYKDHERFEKTYFSSFPGYYFTGDGARRDDDGYYWITGRVDDLMNVSGHLLSTAEIESALTSHKDVIEAACVAAPHDIKGQTPYCFVTLSLDVELTPKLVKELQQIVRNKIGAIAVPSETDIQTALTLPKTRSGKITRRILRKIAEGDPAADLGDLSTLVDENAVKLLWSTRRGFEAKSG